MNEDLKPVNLYCPYCEDNTVFKKVTSLDVRRCEKCEISDRDFHVKTANDLWEKRKIR